MSTKVQELKANLNEKLDAARNKVEASKASLQEKHEENKAQLQSKIESGKAAISEKKEQAQNKVASLKEKFDAFKHDKQAEHAQDKADNAAIWAASCIEFALVSIEEADLAILAAVEAQIEADEAQG
jgi:translation elongation factor EF-G